MWDINVFIAIEVCCSQILSAYRAREYTYVYVFVGMCLSIHLSMYVSIINHLSIYLFIPCIHTDPSNCNLKSQGLFYYLTFNICNTRFQHWETRPHYHSHIYLLGQPPVCNQSPLSTASPSSARVPSLTCARLACVVWTPSSPYLISETPWRPVPW